MRGFSRHTNDRANERFQGGTDKGRGGCSKTREGQMRGFQARPRADEGG